MRPGVCTEENSGTRRSGERGRRWREMLGCLSVELCRENEQVFDDSCCV